MSGHGGPRVSQGDLEQRLELVRSVLARSPDPLDAPFALAFEPMDGRAYVRAWEDFVRAAQAGSVHDATVLYVHLPFCARLCSYCLLSAERFPGKSAFDDYLRALHRQIEMFEPVARPLRFSSLHVGGGTPTLLSEQQLDELLGALTRFGRADGFQIGVEAHPSTASPAKLRVLANRGVHRVSFGVESFTEAVLVAVNRADQTGTRVRAAVDEARACGLSVNLDLLAGLPGETETSFAQTIQHALDLSPDSMSVNRFLVENSALEESSPGNLDEETRRVDRMLLEADRLIRRQAPPRWPSEPLGVPGYGTQYVWDRTDNARGYFQQDMIGPASTLALGQGGMGHIVGRLHSIAAGGVAEYTAALERGEPPPMLVSPLKARFEMAFFLADRMCRDTVSPADFTRVFRVDPRQPFGDELAFLVRQGLLRNEDGRLRKAARRDFQVTHLLAFLALDVASLEATSRSLVDDGAARGPRLQYEAIQAELPPSLLWCRMAIRASRARGVVQASSALSRRNSS